jgi:hypothetical protein
MGGCLSVILLRLRQLFRSNITNKWIISGSNFSESFRADELSQSGQILSPVNAPQKVPSDH